MDKISAITRFTSYNYFLTASSAVYDMSDYCVDKYMRIHAKEKYDRSVENSIKDIIKAQENLEYNVRHDHYEEWKSGIEWVQKGCFAFLGILGVICIMNMINTMISNVNIRKKEYGMLQATMIMVAILLAVQLAMTFVISSYIKKETIINRIRFSN